MAEEVEKGTFVVPDPYQMLEELAIMIENTNVTHTFFASNHASNYLPIKVWLPEDKEQGAPGDHARPQPEGPLDAEARVFEGACNGLRGCAVAGPVRRHGQMGIVYYGAYPVYFEVGRSEYMREKGFTYRELEEMGYSLMVSGMEIKYYNPAVYDDLLMVRTSIADIQSRGLTFAYEILKDGLTVVLGKTRHICVNAARKPTRLPAPLVQMLKNDGAP